MYLYNEFLMNILNDINIVLCPLKSNSNTIELTVHTSCYWGLGLILCYHGGTILKLITKISSIWVVMNSQI